LKRREEVNETQKFDVIMAGGGVIGCATAYYLLQADPTLKVAVVEMDPEYKRNSTVLSDGNIRLQFNIKENILISLYGMERLKTFSEDMAVGDWRPQIDFRQQGNLFLVDQENREEAKAGLAQQQRMKCEVIWLEPTEIKARFPLYDETKFAGGTFGLLDGTMDPQAVLIAFKRKSVHLGATYIEAEVAEVLHSAGKVNGVRLTNGTTLIANYVVNSAGAWGTKLARTAGIELPVEPIRRQVFVLQTITTPRKIYPLTVFPSGLYLIHANGSQFMCGKSFDDDPVGFDFTWNHDKFKEFMWQELVEYVPAFDQLKIVSGWSGLYDVNRFDGNVILGEWPGLKGFLLVNGFSGHGFQQCHAIGRYLSETIRGVDVSLDLSIFSPKRILENKPVFEGHGKLV
jgi:FAD-dependent oxidoreductase domain-containing protein 1